MPFSSTPFEDSLFHKLFKFGRDIKRRDTRNYLLATAGNKKIVFWSLNPYTGDITHERVVCETRGSLVRDITAIAFAADGETLRCATSTGDFLSIDLRSKQVGTLLLSCDDTVTSDENLPLTVSVCN